MTPTPLENQVFSEWPFQKHKTTYNEGVMYNKRRICFVTKQEKKSDWKCLCLSIILDGWISVCSGKLLLWLAQN